MTHICVSKLTIIASDNGLSPGRRQAIIWTNAGILLIGSLGTNFNEILIQIHIISFKKMHLKMSSGKQQPSCLGLNVLTLLDSQASVFHNEGFRLWMIDINNTDIYRWFLKTFHTYRVNYGWAWLYIMSNMTSHWKQSYGDEGGHRPVFELTKDAP